MKKVLQIIILSAVFVSCKQKDSDYTNNREINFIEDSLVYQNNNIYTDEPLQEENTPEVVTHAAVQKKPVKSVPTKQPVKQTAAKAPQQSTENTTEKAVAQPETPVVTPQEQNQAETAGVGQVPEGTGNSGSVEEAQKKGISKAAQGAIIGGASGAVAGAVISKKKGVGAAVGGIIGAAGGYIIGKNKDKKDK